MIMFIPANERTKRILSVSSNGWTAYSNIWSSTLNDCAYPYCMWGGATSHCVAALPDTNMVTFVLNNL